jgi:uracil DNA glycosylase
MIEVGGPHAHFLPRLASRDDLPAWAEQGATLLCQVLDRTAAQRELACAEGVAWTKRFDTDQAIERYLDIYAAVLSSELVNVRPGDPEAGLG